MTIFVLTRKNIKIILSIFAILFGIFIIIFGGYDDSPGAQLIGLLIVLIAVFKAVKRRKGQVES